MKFPVAMLRDFVQTTLDAEALGDLLTMAGFELEGIEDHFGEPVLDIKVVSNRGDGLSVFGLSREVLAKDSASHPTPHYQAAAARFQSAGTAPTLEISDSIAEIQSEFCNRFAVRKFTSIPTGQSSPEWMQTRLEAAGMRPISLLVDLTNYVMLELGQPLHAFDFDRLSDGRIIVRHARAGEKLTTLNGIEHELAGQMMICDGAKPIGVPGVMGGLDTEVSDSTTTVLLESAHFSNLTVRKTRKQLGLNTEASYRFERSVDPAGVVAAIERFTQLLLQSCPEVKISNIVDHYPGRSEFAAITLRVNRASDLLGMSISIEESETYLQRLGMQVSRTDDYQLSVQPPSWRPDLVREEDLVEELGRVHGYERIPEHLPSGSTPLGGPQGKEYIKDRLRDSLLRSGFSQMISHSLRSEHPLDEHCERVAPRNPASPEHNVLRSSLLPGLAEAAKRNGGKDLHLFEIGKVFYQWEGEFFESTYVALLSQGALIPATRQNETVPHADFFSMKSAVMDALKSLGLQKQISFEPFNEDERFHPTRTAKITSASGEFVGTLGQIHPSVAEEIGLEPDTVLFEIAWDWLIEGTRPELTLKNISRNPAVRRDIAILVSKDVTYSDIESAIETASGSVLEKQWLFDVFEGKGVPEGQHSLGIGLQFRKLGENFTDEEANQVRDAIASELAKLGATLR